MPSIKSIIVAHVATLAQTGVLEHVPHHNNADASIAQTSALEHGTQTKPVTLHPITLPFHPLSRRRKKSGIQPKHQNRAKSLKLGKGSIVSPHFPPTQWTPLDNPFMGSLQPQTSRSRHTTAMSMRSDRSSVISSDSDEERERADVERRQLEDEGIIGDSGNINPALIVGYIWEGEKAILDDTAPYRFVRRGEVDFSEVANHVQVLSSDMFNWRTMGYLMMDIFSKSQIEGDKRDFMYFMYRLASLANTMGDKNVGRILEQQDGSRQSKCHE